MVQPLPVHYNYENSYLNNQHSFFRLYCFQHTSSSSGSVYKPTQMSLLPLSHKDFTSLVLMDQLQADDYLMWLEIIDS